MSSLVPKSKHAEVNPYDIVINLMNQPDFRILFDTHFNDFSEIKAILLIMKTYQYVENIYMSTHGKRPTKSFMYTGIRKLMANHETRKFLVDSTQTFMQDQDSFEKIIEQNLDKKILFSMAAQAEETNLLEG